VNSVTKLYATLLFRKVQNLIDEGEYGAGDTWKHQGERWIGIDLDGTLALYDGWKGPDHIGKPIPHVAMVFRMLVSKGYLVRIFTTRAAIVNQIPPIRKWLRDNQLPEVEVTCIKAIGCIAIIDDKSISVQTNTGQLR